MTSLMTIQGPKHFSEFRSRPWNDDHLRLINLDYFFLLYGSQQQQQ